MKNAVSNYENQDHDELKFTAPKAHWQPILEALRPYHRGVVYEKGKKIGRIQIRLKNNERIVLGLLLLSDDGVWFSLDEKQCIGGDKRTLYQALVTAKAAAEHN